jgi:mono/diheme cytochrome c family protein
MFMYTPIAGFDGSDSFQYKAFDGTSQSNTATVSLTVAGGATTTTTTTTTTSTTTTTTAAPAIDAATIYAANCAGCHGADGSGGAGPSLITSTMDYDQILNVISNGAGFMPGYAGSLTADELDALSNFTLAFQGPPATTTTTTTTTAPPATTTTTTTAVPAIDAAAIYATNCAGCHGADGSGGAGPNLITSTLTYGEILNVISVGAGFMPGYAGTLSAAELDALSSFTLDFQGPPATTTTTAPPVATTTSTAAPGGPDGATIYASDCAGCHGANMEGGFGPALANTTMGLAEIESVTAGGAGAMPGFAASLSGAQITAVSQFILDGGTSPGGTTVPATTTTVGPPQSGQQLYGSFCAGCHGTDAQGTPLGPDILDEDFWNIVDAIINGQPDMPEFGSVLSTEQVHAIADYVIELSWNRSTPTTTGPSATTTTAPPVTTTAPPVTTTAPPVTTTTAPPVTTTAPPVTTTAPPVIDAAAIYSANCAGCHGPNGEGGAGPSLIASTMTFDEILNVLNNGAGFMPGYAGSLSPEELDALAAFTLAFQTP